MTANREVISAFPLKCVGAYPNEAPLKPPVEIPVTIFKEDGVRELGCPYLDRETENCNVPFDDTNVSRERLKCFQLFPINNFQHVLSMWREEVRVPLDSYGEAVRHYLNRLRMTQATLAKCSGISQSSLNRSINGKGPPPRSEVIMKQIEVFGLNPNEAMQFIRLVSSPKASRQDTV